MLLTLCASLQPAHAYEADVHLGLTRWLALRAGFAPAQADAIARGNLRADGGVMDTLSLSLEYACVGRHADVAAQARSRHFPSTAALDAAQALRDVVPGGEAARSALRVLLTSVAGKEGLMLSKFGEALHPLQDSFSHQGAAEGPAMLGTLACDPSLMQVHSVSRGGAHTHDADHTHRYPADAMAMAKASYAALTAYPPVAGHRREHEPWERLEPLLTGFVRASSKTEKRQWFVQQGWSDTHFLAGATLPDGPSPGELQWSEHRLPSSQADTSSQHEVDVAVRAFFDAFIARWLRGDAPETLVGHGGRTTASAELAARMKLWTVRDHGLVASMAHMAGPLSARQRKRADQLAGDAGVPRVRGRPSELLLPLQAIAPYATALSPYVVQPLMDRPGVARAVAVFRFFHAPYDTVALVAERRESGWVVTELVSVVDN